MQHLTSTEQLRSKGAKAFFEHWLSLCNGDELPVEFDLLGIPDLVQNIVVVDVVDMGGVVRFFGAHIAKVRGIELTNDHLIKGEHKGLIERNTELGTLVGLKLQPFTAPVETIEGADGLPYEVERLAVPISNTGLGATSVVFYEGFTRKAKSPS